MSMNLPDCRCPGVAPTRKAVSASARSRESVSDAVIRGRKALPCGRMTAARPRLIGCRISDTYVISPAKVAWLLRCKVTLPAKARKTPSTASGGDRAADEGRLERGRSRAVKEDLQSEKPRFARRVAAFSLADATGAGNDRTCLAQDEPWSRAFRPSAPCPRLATDGLHCPALVQQGHAGA
jgi:hypothetical protein